MEAKLASQAIEVVAETLAGDPEAVTLPATRSFPASWDSSWIAGVEAKERELGRKICGARTVNGTPCTMTPNHSNGRCKSHGGFELTGAPAGNRNALLHGLYSHRLQVCGDHCPMWKECPCANEEILLLPRAERPTCPYEAALYEELVRAESYEVETGRSGRTKPIDRHLPHAGAMLGVLSWRAAAALRSQTLLGTARVKRSANGEGAGEESIAPSIHPYTQLYLRFTREYERHRRLIHQREDWRVKNWDTSGFRAEYEDE